MKPKNILCVFGALFALIFSVAAIAEMCSGPATMACDTGVLARAGIPYATQSNGTAIVDGYITHKKVEQPSGVIKSRILFYDKTATATNGAVVGWTDSARTNEAYRFTKQLPVTASAMRRTVTVPKERVVRYRDYPDETNEMSMLEVSSTSGLPVLMSLTNMHGDVSVTVTNCAPIYFQFNSSRVLNASNFTGAVQGPFVLNLKEIETDKYIMSVSPVAVRGLIIK